MRSLNKKNFFVASSVSMVIAVALIILSFSIGKQAFFLLLNTDAGKFFDQFFRFCTYGGEEWAWIALLIITLFILKRKDSIVLLIGAVVFSTIIAQGLKNFIFAGEPRPIKAIADTQLIHTVQGVYLSTINSFPSGHTSSAFSIYLTLCLLINRKWWLPAGLVLAMLVAYSRIYLAQHFPLDIAGGIINAIISVWFSMRVQEYWWSKRKSKFF